MTITRVTLGAAALVAGWFATAAVDAAIADDPADPLGDRLVQAAARAVTPPGPAEPPSPPPAAAPAEPPELLGTFRMTRYYVAEEPRRRRRDDTALASAAPGGVTVYDDRGCRPLATVSRRFHEVLEIQGTGRLRDGRIINVSKACTCAQSPCYRPMGGGARWGMASTMQPLQPFRMVAVDPAVIPLGSLLYIPELDGLTMPGQAPWGGFVHDGCVLAADVGGGVDGHQLDFFIGRRAYKKVLDARRRMKHVTVMRGERRCERGASGVARRGAGT